MWKWFPFVYFYSKALHYILKYWYTVHVNVLMNSTFLKFQSLSIFRSFMFSFTDIWKNHVWKSIVYVRFQITSVIYKEFVRMKSHRLRYHFVLTWLVFTLTVRFWTRQNQTQYWNHAESQSRGKRLHSWNQYTECWGCGQRHGCDEGSYHGYQVIMKCCQLFYEFM